MIKSSSMNDKMGDQLASGDPDNVGHNSLISILNSTVIWYRASAVLILASGGQRWSNADPTP